MEAEQAFLTQPASTRAVWIFQKKYFRFWSYLLICGRRTWYL